MIFRAIFWIGLVSVLMPHEPDLGFGRPHTGMTQASGETLSALYADIAAGRASRQHEDETAQSGAIDVASALRGFSLRNLSAIKAEIEESQRARRLMASD